MPREYYFISDLHIGGDAGLDDCDFADELKDFLETLARRGKEPDRDIELVLVGDTFGFWELSGHEGSAKLEYIVSRHQELFEQFRRAGEVIDITLCPGNHDYELACYPEFGDYLAGYNMHLDRNYVVTRTCAGKTIWIEHGHQHDALNATKPYGDPHVRPIGYYITRRIVTAAAKRSRLGKRDWLVDIESVNPSENVPNWLVSNYFYREMNPVIRGILAPFLLLSGLSLLILLGTLLEWFGLVPARFFGAGLFNRTPVVGAVLRYFITLNVSAMAVVTLVAIPVFIIMRDLRRTLDRYELRFTHRRLRQKDAGYRKAAARVFDEHPEVALFVYGHTHVRSLTLVDGRAILNTGTWLKCLTRLRKKLTLVPDIYYPSYRIGYFRVSEENGSMVIEHQRIPKSVIPELTVLQRLLTIWKDKSAGPDIPHRTVLPS